MIGYILLSAHCMQIMQMQCLFSVFVFLCNWPLFQSSTIAGLLSAVDYNINSYLLLNLSNHHICSLWSPYVIGQTIIFLPCDFYLSSFFLFFPRLISAAVDWMSTILPHMVWS